METSQASVASIDIDALVQHNLLPVLIDCYAPGCGPCATLSPLLDLMAVEMAVRITIEKIDVAGSPDVARAYEIRSVPTLLLFKGGKLLATRPGAASRTQLLTWLSAQGAI